MDDDDPFVEDLETIGPIPEPIPSPVESDDCRINCTDNQSLQDIMKITLSRIPELANVCTSSKDHAEFVSLFTTAYTNALEENILVKGLPWLINSTNLSTPQKEDHKHKVDEALLAKVSKTISDVAHKRKFYPDNCCRIYNIKAKHELQNLKKAKVADSTAPKELPSTSFKRRKTKPFSEICEEFKSIQEDVQYRMKRKKDLEMQMNLASNVLKSHQIKPDQPTGDIDQLKN